MQHMLADMERGQLTHVRPEAYEVGRNLATTPGKVVKRTPLYELIQYTPTTDTVFATPLVIFPPWINRFYILDLTPEKSFIRWAAEQGLTVFMVSWKSADAEMKDIRWDDYVAAQIDAIDTARDLLGVEAVHAIGYCVAGTTLAATLALLAARGESGEGPVCDLLYRAGRLRPARRPQALRRRRAARDDRPAVAGGVSGRPLHGRDLQRAARRRPDLELRHQQLSARRGLPRLRPAPLERGRDQPAGGVAPELSEGSLSRQPADRGRRDVDPRRAARPLPRRDADLCPGRARGSYRAGGERLEDHPPFPRAAALRARRFGSYRRAS
jgi:hypothetical protein